MNAIRTIQARTSERTLGKVTRLFNASLEDILNELLQNARRAGATIVKVELLTGDRHTYLSLSDNGTGIDDPAILLTLGDSDWEEETQNREDPAGMGIFSLANRGAEIHSNGWSVRLEPSHFCGELPAQVYSSAWEVGTKVVFPLDAAEVQKIKGAVAHAAKYYPLPVEFEGERPEQEDFLENALYVEQLQGLRIGVFQYRNSYPMRVNFYGVTLYHPFPCVSQVGGNCDLSVKIDVGNCPALKLVLPARKELVQNQFLAELSDEALRVIYRYLGTLKCHRLSYANWKKAAELGVILREAESKLVRFSPDVADHYSESWCEEVEVPENALILAITEEETHSQQVFWRGLEQADLPYVALEPEPRYQGYSWYDKLPVLSAFHFRFEVEGEQLSAQEFKVRYAHQAKVLVDAITVVATVKQADGSSFEVAFPTDVYLVSEDCWCDLDDVCICLRREHDLNVEVLADLLEAAYFSPSDDSDADSYETQKVQFQESARVRAIATLLSGDEALKEHIRLVLEREVQWLVPEGVRVEISLSPNGTTVRVEKGQ